MSENSFGHLFRLTSWGESHGPSIGCVVDGVPPRLPLAAEDIQFWLDRRRGGQNRFTTQRKEPDRVQILSGVYTPSDGVQQSTGAPISLLIENEDVRSKDYSEIADKFRPGHADYTYFKKYGIRDPRGGGRSSARETAVRVAAGAIARKVISDIEICGALVQLGTDVIDRDHWDWDTVLTNPFWCPDRAAAERWESILDSYRKAGDSCGAVIEIIARNVPAGWGAPVYGKLDAALASAMMSINAVKGVEVGAGFAVAGFTGSLNADELLVEDGIVHFTRNHAGGILGGISTGQDIVVRFAVKPTSSILTPKRTISVDGRPTTIKTKGRHDPCVGIRAVPVGEAMMALVLADHKLRHHAQNSS